MATVKTREFKHTGKSGETIQFKSPITVDSQGEFTINIPAELAPTARALTTQPVWKGHVEVTQARVNWRIQGGVLSTIERFVEEAMKEHLAVEVKQELVILYRYENNTTFARAADGSIHPNGHFAAEKLEDDARRSWEWGGNRNIHSNNRPRFFGVGVVARAYLKLTYTRPGSSKVEYKRDLPGSHWDQNSMRRLNSYIVQDPVLHGYETDHFLTVGCDKPSSEGVQEMPYSDAAADFFSDLMLVMCRLGDQLDAFVGNKDNLLIAIKNGAHLLPGAGSDSAIDQHDKHGSEEETPGR